MANEHLKTAASNIQRAVQDVRTLQSQVKADMENTKRNNASTINGIKTEMAQLNVAKFNPNASDSDKTAANARQHMLQTEISRIQADTDKFVHEQTQQMSNLENQINEFENLANHLNNIA